MIIILGFGIFLAGCVFGIIVVAMMSANDDREED